MKTDWSTGLVVYRSRPNVISRERINTIFGEQNFSGFAFISNEYDDPVTGERVIVGWMDHLASRHVYAIATGAFHRAKRYFYLDSKTVVDAVFQVTEWQPLFLPENVICCAKTTHPTHSITTEFTPHTRIDEWYTIGVLTTDEQANKLWGFSSNNGVLDEENGYELTVINGVIQPYVEKHIAYDGVWDRYFRQHLKNTQNINLRDKYLRLMWGLTNN